MLKWKQVLILASLGLLLLLLLLHLIDLDTAVHPVSRDSRDSWDLSLAPLLDPEVQPKAELGRSGGSASRPAGWLPPGFRRVWFDIGTAGRSDFRRDLKEDLDLFLISVEPTPSFADEVEAVMAQNETRNRFHMIRAACSDVAVAKLAFYVHPLQECNSLRRTRPGHGKVFNGECVGKEPKKIEVDAVTLADIFEQLPDEVEIELLKIDVQGHEWPCLEGAGPHLQRVQNIFLEIQDLPEKEAMYEGALDVASMDQRLRVRNFHRQYCEINSPELHEINCLYTRQGSSPLWVTGRPQKKKRLVQLDLQKKPGWKGVEYLGKLRTSEDKGQMHGRLCDLGLLKSKYCAE